MHIDLNSYFASVEQQDNPAFRGKPLGVCEHLGGILIAASVEAKKWGIKTGTPVWEAKKLYPKIILSKTHPDRYRLYSDRLMKILRDYSGMVEQYSIDEAFVDLTQVCNIDIRYKNEDVRFTNTENVLNHKSSILHFANPFEEAVRIGCQIKLRMKTEVGDWLRCSIGIAENKLLAKIASDLQKPDGMVVVRSDEWGVKNDEGGMQSDECRIQSEKWGVQSEKSERCDCSNSALCTVHSPLKIFSKAELYKCLSLTDIPGIGSRQEKRLNELGIRTVAELRDYPKTKLVARFGVLGFHLHEMGNLRSSWKPKVDQEDTIKSIGHMYTLPKQYRQQKFFIPVLYKLCEMVARRMRVQELTGNVLHFHIHNNAHECFGKSRRLGYYVQDGREIFMESVKIFESVVQAAITAPQEFKLIGVTIAGLADISGQQSLFPYDRRVRGAVAALDQINEKYGDFTICRVPVKLASNVFHDSIGFGRIKEHARIASSFISDPDD